MSFFVLCQTGAEAPPWAFITDPPTGDITDANQIFSGTCSPDDQVTLRMSGVWGGAIDWGTDVTISGGTWSVQVLLGTAENGAAVAYPRITRGVTTVDGPSVNYNINIPV